MKITKGKIIVIAIIALSILIISLPWVGIFYSLNYIPNIRIEVGDDLYIFIFSNLSKAHKIIITTISYLITIILFNKFFERGTDCWNPKLKVQT